MMNFQLNLNEMINSIDLGNVDHSEIKESDEVLKEINSLRDQIAKKLDDISIFGNDLENRENNFKKQFNELESDKKELFKKLEDEFILNTQINIDSDKNINILKNVNSDIINDENVGMLNMNLINFR